MDCHLYLGEKAHLAGKDAGTGANEMKSLRRLTSGGLFPEGCALRIPWLLCLGAGQ